MTATGLGFVLRGHNRGVGSELAHTSDIIDHAPGWDAVHQVPYVTKR
jgi:hypothetical protein